MLATGVVMIPSLWKVFAKTGQPGVGGDGLLPTNAIVPLQITGRTLWWIILFMIPLVNFIIGILVVIERCQHGRVKAALVPLRRVGRTTSPGSVVWVLSVA